MKSRFCVVLVFVVASALDGCETPPEAHTADSVDLGADFVGHAPSGLRFPETLAGFERGEIRTYDEDGENRSFAYNRVNPFERVVLTIYVYPAPSVISIGSPDDVVESARRKQLDVEFESCVESITEKYSDTALLSEHAGEMPFCDHLLPGRAARYRILGLWGPSGPPAISSLCLLRNGRWWIKLGATFPEATAASSEQRIAALLAELDETNRAER